LEVRAKKLPHRGPRSIKRKIKSMKQNNKVKNMMNKEK